MKPSPRVLVADDQPDVREALRLLLKAEGFAIEAVDSPAALLAALDKREFDVVLMDLNYARDTTSGAEGLDLLSRLQALDPTCRVVVMTAWASVDLAVEAMRRGARDFVQKPWENARLLTILRTQAELAGALRQGQRLEAENRALRGEAARRADRGGAGHAAGAGDDRARRPFRRQRAHHRRERLRQGHGRARAARGVPAGRAAAGHRERGRTLRGRLRERAVRAREGRLHRRQDRPGGPLRAGRRRHALPGRDRERPPEPAAEAAARAGDGRVRAGGLLAHAAGGRARPLRHQRRPATRKWPPAASARTCSSASTPSRSACRRCASGREDIPLLAQHFLAPARPPLPQDASPASSRPPCARCTEHAWPGNVRELDHAVERAVLMAAGGTIRVRRPGPAAHGRVRARASRR